MKKLLALLLSMVMAASLAVPAFAAPDTGVSPEEAVPISAILPEVTNDSVLGIIGGADGPTSIFTTLPAGLGGLNLVGISPEDMAVPVDVDQYLADHPGLEEQLKANAYDYFAQEYGDYWTAEEYMEYGELTEEEFLADMAYDQAWELAYQDASQKSIDLAKEAMGGVPGQVGVMVNGKYVKFPDAAPEVTRGRTMVPVRALVETLGGEVVYGDQEGLVRLYIDEYTIIFTIGSTAAEMMPRGTDTGKENKTIEMDCAPYIKGGRTYVPIRFISEALGYEVGWDAQFQTAILLDREALAAEIDKDFTILNKVQANRGLAVGEGKSSLTNAKCSVTATMFDTLNGNKTYTADLSGKTLMNAGALNGSYSFTLSDNAVDALMELVMGGEGPEYEEDAAILRSVITGLKELEVIMTAEGKVWAHAPILDELSGEKNVWAGMDLGSELGALFALQMDAGSLTIGSVIADAVEGDSVPVCAVVDEVVQMMAAMYGDDKFSTSGGVSTLIIDVDTMDPDGALGLKDAYKEYTLTMKVDSKGGVTSSCVMETAAQDFVPGMKITMDATQSAGKEDMTVTVHVANVCEIKLTLTASESASTDAPKTEPPKDAVILDADTPMPLPELEGSSN